MNRKLLETFLWTARLGSFRAAADHLNSTQPAVSMRIRQLERELGVQLFARGTRASYLTGKGEEMLPYAERALQVMHAMQHHVADPRTIVETVRVGVAEFVAVTWLAELVREVTAQFPAVSLRLDVDLTHGLVRKLRARELDLALCIGPLAETDLKNLSLGKVELGWFAGPKLDFGKRVRPKDLAHIPMMSLAEDSALHAMALDWFRAANEHCRRVHFCNSMHTVSILVRAGQGFSLLPAEYCRFYLERGMMQRLACVPALPPAEYVALYYQSRTPPIVASIAQIAAQKSGFARR
jgi:DNA-binding transcriptional LysR family regulator